MLLSAVVAEHLDALDALLVVRADSVERIDPKAVEAGAIATPLDPITPVWQARELPKGRLVEIPRAVHTLHEDNPDAVLTALREFLAF